jgi:ferredoxin-NADP reductase
LHDQLKVGDCLKVSAPAGKFVFTGKESSTILLIAGGVGITPLMSIVRYLTDRAWGGDIYLLVIAKKEDGIIFRDELEWLRKRFANLHVCITLTGEPHESNWSGNRGRASAELLLRFVPHLQRVPAYLCGPQSMMDSTKELLLSLGVPLGSIWTEAFVSPGVGKEVKANGSPVNDLSNSPVGRHKTNMTALRESDETFTVSFARSNQSIDVTANSTVLELAEELGIELPFECRSGVCGQCMTKLLRGRVVMDSEDALSQSAKNNQFILACQSHPQTSLVVDA